MRVITLINSCLSETLVSHPSISDAEALLPDWAERDEGTDPGAK
ncbi:hypothetical protein AS9A_3941 [Hoyosella subflava DQS3-9A1]|uniref:Uncharacterized protein n=1 Tax=Hoyosella subflava (strain DSM 45089 / JCM 17490 / NBRC 109087 / DQS3-9A1) TaxID=443218 RepID=F6EHL3_HOYSD|nr:hypothetical protein AS9A_3941 [Hoyosella subflava DQS3-9A1]